MARDFVRFNEHNDHEGEMWTFWLQYSGNEENLALLGELIQQSGIEEEFELDLYQTYKETDVDTVVRLGNAAPGYYPAHSKVVGEFRALDQPDVDAEADDTDYPDYEDACWLETLLYKGGISEHFRQRD